MTVPVPRLLARDGRAQARTKGPAKIRFRKVASNPDQHLFGTGAGLPARHEDLGVRSARLARHDRRDFDVFVLVAHDGFCNLPNEFDALAAHDRLAGILHRMPRRCSRTLRALSRIAGIRLVVCLFRHCDVHVTRKLGEGGTTFV